PLVDPASRFMGQTRGAAAGCSRRNRAHAIVKAAKARSPCSWPARPRAARHTTHEFCCRGGNSADKEMSVFDSRGAAKNGACDDLLFDPLPAEHHAKTCPHFSDRASRRRARRLRNHGLRPDRLGRGGPEPPMTHTKAAEI